MIIDSLVNSFYNYLFCVTHKLTNKKYDFLNIHKTERNFFLSTCKRNFSSEVAQIHFEKKTGQTTRCFYFDFSINIKTNKLKNDLWGSSFVINPKEIAWNFDRTELRHRVFIFHPFHKTDLFYGLLLHGQSQLLHLFCQQVWTHNCLHCYIQFQNSPL